MPVTEAHPALVTPRVSGVVLIAASVMMVTGAAVGFLAPSLRDEPPFVATDIEAAAAAIAGNPAAWQLANGLILAAAIITTFALAPVALRFHDRTRPWAMLGLLSFAMAAVFETIGRLIAIGVTTWAAERYADPTVRTVWESFDQVRLGTVATYLAFAAISLFGLGLARSGVQSGRILAGVGLAGTLLELFGLAIPAHIYLTTASLGVVMLRQPRGFTPVGRRGEL